MKKNKLWVWGMAVLTFGLVLAACNDGSDGADPWADFYGTWKQDASNYTYISDSEISLGNEDGSVKCWTAHINRWEPVANDGANADIDTTEYPSGCRFTGTYTYWNTDIYPENEIDSRLGTSFNTTWYLSADKQSIISSSGRTATREIGKE